MKSLPFWHRFALFACAVCFVMVAFSQKSGQPAPRDIRFGTSRISGYKTYETTLKGKEITAILQGPEVKLESPDQGIELNAPRLEVALEQDKNNQFILKTARATGGVRAHYVNREEKREIKGRAQRADYVEANKTLTLTGQVFIESEDENYIITQRNAEKATLLLNRDQQEVKLEGDPSKNETIITPKKKETP